MEEYVFGANILENLTTGMYQDSRVIYREYIQNACDQIDKAYDMGLLRDEEGCIDIWFDAENRTVSIVDNATGIPSVDFERTLADIANSDKRLGEDKGFRGIGQLMIAIWRMNGGRSSLACLPKRQRKQKKLLPLINSKTVILFVTIKMF